MLYRGHCHCGYTQIALHLPQPLDHYEPRRCDCDFCVSRNISYLSAPTGLIEISADTPLDTLHQGSQQADFLACPQCKTVIAATFKNDVMRIGSLNAQLLIEHDKLRPSISVSPQQLSAEEKLSRWQQLWSKVVLLHDCV
ncbi:hypothetical protein [Pleionea sp. CnH1-48]|uniref:hypothetical protein n=1 Tax=Pleionea sp. CnH1-48 TaxID=2954494 RepID=UPI002096EF70|nr:hypothetical protein [Pleionea sp. CnH1-48]MCO7225346.1 hypothetical protein [Pleionea sp. CnH1-48]